MSYQQPQQGYSQGGYQDPNTAYQYQQYGQQAQYGQQPPQQHYGQHQHQHQQQQQQATAPAQTSGAYHASDSGTFNGGSYTITHRDTNTILSVTLTHGGSVKSKPGAMIEMSASIVLQGKTKFSVKKLFTGGEIHESVYTGTGLITLGPTLFGDIQTLHLDGTKTWNLGKDAFLAATTDVHKETKAQGIGKALFSGEDLFVYRVSGRGVLWMNSFGAITRRELGAGEQHIVDNGHLVAWNCDYKIERAGSGAFSSIKTGEGLVCRFTGPGTIYIQTRNLDEFATFIAETAGLSAS